MDPLSLAVDNPARAAARAATRPLEGGGDEKRKDFASMVGDLVRDANRAQLEAQSKAEGLARGEAGIVETVLAVEKAQMSLRLASEVRNRVLTAWQEITHATR